MLIRLLEVDVYDEDELEEGERDFSVLFYSIHYCGFAVKSIFQVIGLLRLLHVS